MGPDSIGFPNLGISFSHVGQYISIGGFEIAYYGIIIACAMAAGIYLAMWLAKKTGQDPDMYFNFAIIAIILSVIGARLYYVVFSWDYYSAHPLEILDFRGGGLAIYGGVITAVICAAVYAHIHKVPMLKMFDTGIAALALGQAIGRWGNFFNREAFGGYTDGLLAMQLPLEAVRSSEVTAQMLEHAAEINGNTFVQVHPTFLYESAWNFVLVALMVLVTLNKGFKRFDGLIFCMYLTGYGIGRFWIEGLRTDQLLIPGTAVPVSQALSAVLAAAGIILFITLMVRNKRRLRGARTDNY